LPEKIEHLQQTLAEGAHFLSGQ